MLREIIDIDAGGGPLEKTAAYCRDASDGPWRFIVRQEQLDELEAHARETDKAMRVSMLMPRTETADEFVKVLMKLGDRLSAVGQKFGEQIIFERFYAAFTGNMMNEEAEDAIQEPLMATMNLLENKVSAPITPFFDHLIGKRWEQTSRYAIRTLDYYNNMLGNPVLYKRVNPMGYSLSPAEVDWDTEKLATIIGYCHQEEVSLHLGIRSLGDLGSISVANIIRAWESFAGEKDTESSQIADIIRDPEGGKEAVISSNRGWSLSFTLPMDIHKSLNEILVLRCR